MIDFFKSEKIIRLTPLSKDTEAVADRILAGDVRVFPKLPNVRVSSLDELWETKFDSAPSTYALYVYALYPISYLLNAYELKGKNAYLDRAVSLALDFLGWESRSCNKLESKRRRILLGDHAVSNRTQALCYLVCCLVSDSRKLPEELVAALLRNGEYLSDSGNYSHYNHGLMMDLSLLGLLNTLEGLKQEYPSSFKANLIARLQYSICRDLTEDGVHVENSPGYHFWMLRFLEKITPALQALDNDLYFKAKGSLEKASEYASFITRPDGTVPAIGDTHAGLMYKPSKGLSSKYFKLADQVIFRDADSDVWAFFGSGYKTHVHKHSDNGAFNLYYKGRDVFIDPGFLNYEGVGDSILIRSASFHNTAVPIGKEQSLTAIDLSAVKHSYNKNISRSRIVGFSCDAELEYAMSIVADYPGVELERLVVWLKPNLFIILDNFSSSDEGIDQVFHISPALTPKLSGNEADLLSSNGQTIARLACHAIESDKNVSMTASLQPGFYARSFGIKGDSQRIVFRSSGACLLTAVELVDNDEPPVIIEEFDRFLVKYKLHGKRNTLDLSELKRRLSDLNYRALYRSQWQLTTQRT